MLIIKGFSLVPRAVMAGGNRIRKRPICPLRYQPQTHPMPHGAAHRRQPIRNQPRTHPMPPRHGPSTIANTERKAAGHFHRKSSNPSSTVTYRRARSTPPCPPPGDKGWGLGGVEGHGRKHRPPHATHATASTRPFTRNSKKAVPPTATGLPPQRGPSPIANTERKAACHFHRKSSNQPSTVTYRRARSTPPCPPPGDKGWGLGGRKGHGRNKRNGIRPIHPTPPHPTIHTKIPKSPPPHGAANRRSPIQNARRPVISTERAPISPLHSHTAVRCCAHGDISGRPSAAPGWSTV